MTRIKKKAAALCCCALLAAFLLIGAALVAALYFVVLRPRPPQVVATRVYTQLGAFSILPPALNFSLTVNITVHNPGHAPFRYSQVVTAVTYYGAAVGRSVVPAGKIRARSKRTVGARVRVDTARVILSGHYVVDLVAGALPFEAKTSLAGKEAALWPFGVSADAEVACSVILYPFKRESSSHCTYTVRLVT